MNIIKKIINYYILCLYLKSSIKLTGRNQKLKYIRRAILTFQLKKLEETENRLCCHYSFFSSFLKGVQISFNKLIFYDYLIQNNCRQKESYYLNYVHSDPLSKQESL